ncbi:uncharacterized protein LOC129607002, partial [Condylostylus longicornis]|uniref:uncharacterized protein LOC129607002 n=1 Tax=Condylostylus longicornis TaxID=2530218 RepID=UPI00244D9B31
MSSSQTRFRVNITTNNILLSHLSITQILLSLVFLIFSFPVIVINGAWIASAEFSCKLNGFLLITLHPLVLWTICGLNWDRFYAISAPLHYNTIVTNKKVTLGLITGWIGILFLSIPTFTTVAPHKFNPTAFVCTPNFSAQNSLWYASIFTFTTLIVPGIIIIICNIKVLMIARNHRHRIAAAIYEVTLSAQVTITHQRNPFLNSSVTAPASGSPLFRSRSPVSMVLQLIISFILIYLPYYLSIISNSLASFIYNKKTNDIASYEADGIPKLINKANQYIVLVSQCSLTSSTVINAFLYGFKNKTIRTTFHNYWRKKRTKNEIHQEIQARTPSMCGSRRPSLSNSNFLINPLLQRRLPLTFSDAEQRSVCTSPNHEMETSNIKYIRLDLSRNDITCCYPSYIQQNVVFLRSHKPNLDRLNLNHSLELLATKNLLKTLHTGMDEKKKAESIREIRLSETFFRKYLSICNLQEYIENFDFKSNYELAEFCKRNRATNDKIFETNDERAGIEYIDELDNIYTCFWSGSTSFSFSRLQQRKYSSMKDTFTLNEEHQKIEEQLLLSWPTTRKKLKLYASSTFNRKKFSKKYENMYPLNARQLVLSFRRYGKKCNISTQIS